MEAEMLWCFSYHGMGNLHIKQNMNKTMYLDFEK